MSVPVIAPMGRGQALMVREGQKLVAADINLIFAATADLYSLKPRVQAEQQQYRFYTAYRLTDTFQIANIFGPGTSADVEAYKKARRAQETAIDVKDETKNVALANVPEVPLSMESRILPPGSLLLRAVGDDGPAKWFSLTPDELQAEGLFRADGIRCNNPVALYDACGCKTVPTNVDLDTQMRQVRHWKDSEARKSHKNDIRVLQEIAEPVFWKRLLKL